MSESLSKITLASGCFWCSEAVFQRLDGVEKAVSGYIGGTLANPSYEQVCSGRTGHAEAIEISFNPQKVSLRELLDLFWKSHDPTTLNRQGADVGTQYRSGIFYHNAQQKTEAEQSKARAQKSFSEPVVTEITEASTFYPAEDYHQDYFKTNPSAGYCSFVIAPKIKQLEAEQS